MSLLLNWSQEINLTNEPHLQIFKRSMKHGKSEQELPRLAVGNLSADMIRTHYRQPADSVNEAKNLPKALKVKNSKIDIHLQTVLTNFCMYLHVFPKLYFYT